MTPLQEDSMKLRQAAFCLETVAHLRGLEHELLPLAEALREIAERTYPSRPAGREGHEVPLNQTQLSRELFGTPLEAASQRNPSQEAGGLVDVDWVIFKEEGK